MDCHHQGSPALVLLCHEHYTGQSVCSWLSMSRAEVEGVSFPVRSNSANIQCVAQSGCPPTYPPTHPFVSPHTTLPTSSLGHPSVYSASTFSWADFLPVKRDKWGLGWCLCMRGCLSVHMCAGTHAFVCTCACGGGVRSQPHVSFLESRPPVFLSLSHRELGLSGQARLTG